MIWWNQFHNSENDTLLYCFQCIDTSVSLVFLQWLHNDTTIHDQAWIHTSPHTETDGKLYVKRAGWKLMNVMWYEDKWKPYQVFHMVCCFLVSDFIFLHYKLFQKYQLLLILPLTNCAVTRQTWLISKKYILLIHLNLRVS